MIENSIGQKNKRTVLFVVVIALGIGLIFLFNYLFVPKGQTESEPPIKKFDVGKPEQREEESFKKLYNDELSKLKGEISELQKQQLQKDKELKGQQQKMSGPSTPLPTVPPVPPPPQINQYPPSGNMPLNSPKQEPEEKLLKDLIKVVKATQVIEEKKSEPPPSEVSSVLPAGSLIRSVLVSGVDAPTGGKAIGNPHPIMLKVMDRAFLPNKFRADIVDCLFVGSAYGELSSERAYVRIEKLSCMTAEGKAVERQVNGYVAGEDGKVGIAGEVITKQGQILARALIAGFLEGAGKLLQQSYSTIVASPSGTLQTVNPEDVVKAGLAGGASEAAKKLSDFYMKLANEMFPVIEINAMRKVDVILLSGVEV